MVERLERQLQQVRRRVDQAPLEGARQLAVLERELLEAIAAPANGGNSDPARLILAELHEFRKLCQRLDQSEGIESVERVTRTVWNRLADCRHAELVQWVTGERTAADCFQRLLQTTVLQLEARGQVPAGQAVAEARWQESRELLRGTMRQCVEREPVPVELRRQWARELSDRADLLLTAIDDQPPDAAADQLRLLAEHLQWHLEYVEGRGEGNARILKRKLRRLQAEHQERQLQHRLENRFGSRPVAAAERLVLVLIVLVVGLLTVELLVPLSPTTLFWFHVADGLACLVFLGEFTVKWSLASGRGSWFRRHALIDLIPSIPIGLLTAGLAATSTADLVRLGRLGRLLRLPRLVRYVRLLRPALYLMRAVGLLARGLDRLARQYGHVFNHTVILYPTRAELEQAGAGRTEERSRLRGLQVELRQCWRRLISGAERQQGAQMVAARIEALDQAAACAPARDPSHVAGPALGVREVPLSVLIERLERVTPVAAEAYLGEELVGQLARPLRVLAHRPLRWLPLLSTLVPPLDEEITDAEVVARGSRRLAGVLRRFHDLWFWFADLYGTVSPSQFLDRLGTMLVYSSYRPAYRLLMAAGGLLAVRLALLLTDQLGPFEALVDGFLGPTVLVLGGVCFLLLGLGWWLKRLAQEATEFYERSAQAQFLGLTETIRSRHLDRDARILVRRVLANQWQLDSQQTAQAAMQFADHLRQTLQQPHTATAHDGPLRGLESVVLLYRDWLDGGLFTDSDTRATSQLLGNPAIGQLLHHAGRIDRRQIRSLQALDLVRQKALLGGPYLWFNFVSRSIVHSVACLLVDYNQQAIPRSELPLATADERARYERWLAGPERDDRRPPKPAARGSAPQYVTTAFTALHFLDCDGQRDREVEQQFGPEVRRRLEADRSLLIRRIFGTYPRHERPKEQRMVNLYALYNGWLAGGRALLLPWFVLLAAGQLVAALLWWIVRAVREIRDPELRRQNRNASRAHFRTAVRKIQRIRGPVVMAGLRLRIRLDPEYLGVPLPGQVHSPPPGGDVDRDLRFLLAGTAVWEEVEQQRRWAEADMQRLARWLQQGVLEQAAVEHGLPADAFAHPQYHRAAAVAYLADYDGLRRHLSARQLLDEVYRLAATEPPLPARSFGQLKLKRRFHRYWQQHGFGGQRERKAAWAATQKNVWAVADALEVWDRLGTEAAEAEGRKRLAQILVHPRRISEQLLTLRMVQTLAVLDVLHYRQHVFQLGRYQDIGDLPGELLQWMTT